MNTAARTRAAFAVPDAQERQQSVASAMRALLNSGIRADDLRYLLDMSLWRYTEYDKNKYKFATRYRTATVLGQAPVEINHEHVVERRWLLDRITAQPDQLDGYLQLAVACIVSRDEHILLTGTVGFGWERYALAEIHVIDTATMQPLDLKRAVAAQRKVLRQLGESTNETEIPAAPAGDALLRPFAPAPRPSIVPSHRASGAAPENVAAAIRSLSGKAGRRLELHLAVDAALTNAGYTAALPGGSGGSRYISYVDPASGRNFLNLTASIAHLMRQDLRPQLSGETGVRLAGRYPQIHLDDVEAVATISRLAARFKR